MLKDVNEKINHEILLLSNHFIVHGQTLHPSSSAPVVCLGEAPVPMNQKPRQSVHCIFVIAKAGVVSGSCPSTGKGLHSGIKYLTVLKIIALKLHM